MSKSVSWTMSSKDARTGYPGRRLKAPWEGLGPWQAREERWEAVRHAPTGVLEP